MYSPFPINPFTPGYPLYLRPESPVSTLHRSASSDLVLGLTDAEQMEAKFAARLFEDIIPVPLKDVELELYSDDQLMSLLKIGFLLF
ncbi:hypothetical protein L208DRAFT_1394994 [Tricholoma matsutake]|nr:hypothetical protein L208DRAFT_1394994 [Tricholoma matsutake 945]